jgi:hypothetical protein
MSNPQTTTYEQKYAAAEGLVNYLEGDMSHGSKVSAVMDFAQRVYDMAREHEREDIRARI